jgi:hypothetical protein
MPVPGNCGDELLRPLDVEYGETTSLLPGQIDILGRVRQKQLPPHRLPQGREEDRMCVTDRARRQRPFE